MDKDFNSNFVHNKKVKTNSALSLVRNGQIVMNGQIPEIFG